MRANEFITEIERRGFLKGLGASAAAVAAPFMINKTPGSNEPTKKSEPLVPMPTLSSNPAIEKKMYALAASASPPIEGVELAQFMAQTNHESQGFTKVHEDGGPKYWHAKYDVTKNPANAKDLGNVKPGDGVAFHGRGFIQVTGRWNYTAAGKFLGIPLASNPDLAATLENAGKLALWFWNTRVRARVSDFTDTATVTKAINKQLDKLDRRTALFMQYLPAIRKAEAQNKIIKAHNDAPAVPRTARNI